MNTSFIYAANCFVYSTCMQHLAVFLLNGFCNYNWVWVCVCVYQSIGMCISGCYLATKFYDVATLALCMQPEFDYLQIF